MPQGTPPPDVPPEGQSFDAVELNERAKAEASYTGSNGSPDSVSAAMAKP